MHTYKVLPKFIAKVDFLRESINDFIQKYFYLSDKGLVEEYIEYEDPGLSRFREKKYTSWTLKVHHRAAGDKSVHADQITGENTDGVTTWFYPSDGVERWSGECRGKRQSPIDITDNDIEKEELIELKLFNYENYIIADCENNGHTVILKISPDDNIYVVGGDDRDNYILQQIHFHWNSEHRINGESYPMEVHFVHALNKNRIRRHTGLSQDDSLHVLAVLFKMSKDNNTKISRVVDLFDSVSMVGEKNSLVFSPRNLLPEDTNQYYRYDGSLTTPGCNEVVQWTIFSSHVEISKEQYDVIWKTQTFNGSFSQNFRHTQPLNNRTLKYISSAGDLSQTVTNTILLFVSVKISTKFL